MFSGTGLPVCSEARYLLQFLYLPGKRQYSFRYATPVYLLARTPLTKIGHFSIFLHTSFPISFRFTCHIIIVRIAASIVLLFGDYVDVIEGEGGMFLLVERYGGTGKW